MNRTDDVVEAVTAGFSDLWDGTLRQALGVRVELTGTTCLHESLEAESIRLSQAIQSRAIAESGGRLWVEKLVMRTRPDVGSAQADAELADDALAEIAGVIDELRADPQLISALLKEGECGELIKKLPPEVRSAAEGHDPLSDTSLAAHLARAESVLSTAVRRAEIV
jgi:hypothetical protein